MNNRILSVHDIWDEARSAPLVICGQVKYQDSAEKAVELYSHRI